MMKFVLLLLLFFSLPVFSQAPVEPIKVAIEEPAKNEHNHEFQRHIRTALNRLRYVAIVPKTSQIHVVLALDAAPISECGGFSGALGVTTTRGNEVFTHTGSLEYLARYFVARLEREYFTKRRHAPKD